MRDSINLVIEVFEKATLIVSCDTPLIQSNWCIKYSNGVISDWKESGLSILLNPGTYELEFNDIVGYNKPDNYICLLKSGQTKKVNISYTKKLTSDLQISFNIPSTYQRNLSWKLTQLQGNTIVDWSRDINYKENLPNGKYQLQIKDYLSNSVSKDDINFGNDVGSYKFHIIGEIYIFDLNKSTIITRKYETNLILSPLTSVFNCTINPVLARDNVQWRLVSSTITSLIWLNSGVNVIVPYDTYYLQTLTKVGWIVNDYEHKIIINTKTKNVILTGRLGETTLPSGLTSNVCCTINPVLARDNIQWRLVSPVIISEWQKSGAILNTLHETYQLQALTINGWKVNEIQTIKVDADKNLSMIGISPILTKYGTICCTINPEKARPFIKWKLSPQSVWYESGNNVIVPYGTYYLQTTTVYGWTVSKKEEAIIVDSDKDVILIGIKAEKNGNLRIKLETKNIKDSARWKPINTSIWYMDNEEISLYPNTYEIEFKPVENYETPINQFYKVYEDEVNIYSNTYYHLGSLQINILPNAILETFGEPLWCVKNTNIWRKSGEIIFLASGAHTIQFNTIGNIFTREDYDLSISNEQTVLKEISFVGINLFVVPTKTNINFYNFNNLQKLSILPELSSFVDTNQVIINYNDTLLAIAHNASPYLTIYNLINYDIYCDKKLIKPIGGCRSLDFSNDGKYLAVSYNNFPYLVVYNTNDWTQIDIDFPPSNYCNTVKFSPNSLYLAVGFDKSPYIKIYYTPLFTPLTITSQIDKEVFSCQFDSSNSYLGIGCYHTAYIYNINFELIQLDVHGTIYGVEFLNNYLIVISSLYFYIYHYEKETSTYTKKMKILVPIPNINNYITLSPDQKYLIIGCVDYPYVIIYETTNWTQVPFDGNLLNYCKKMTISGDLSLREYVNIPTHVQPVNKHRGQREFEPLISSDFSFFSMTRIDTHIKSQWRLLDINEAIVYDSEESDDLISHLIPESYFDIPKDYFWQVRHKGTLFGWSFWSKMTSFSVVYSTIKKPVNVLPLNEAIDVIEHPTLTSTNFEVINATDTHIYSQWNINDIQIKIPSGDTTDYTSYTVPEGILNGQTVYNWQVRHKGQVLGWSDWSDKTSFTTGIWKIEKPVNISPYDNEVDINETDLTLSTSEFTVLNSDDTHITSRYEIYEDHNYIVHTSGDRLTTTIDYKVPSGILIDGLAIYHWRVAYKGNQLGWSEWSDFTYFTTRILQTSKVFVDIYPSQILSGMSTRLRWKWKLKNALDSTYSLYITPATYEQIPSGQSIKISFEDYPKLTKPSDIILDNILAGETYTYNVIYSPQSGNGKIKCNITDDLLGYAKWKIVNTSVWRDSGYTETDMIYDVYDIEFNDVVGYIKPDNIQNIIIKNSTLIIKTATYTVDEWSTYFVIVNTGGPLDPCRINSWRLNSEPDILYNGGEKASLFGKSVESIVFSNMPGYITPNDITFQIPNTYDQNPDLQADPEYNPKTLVYSRTYLADNIGQLKCNLSPGYAKWEIVEDNWNNTATILDVAEARYIIRFEKINGYKNILDTEAIVVKNTLTTISKVYELESTVGSLKMYIKPPDGCFKLKTLSVDWYASDFSVDAIPIGEYTVEFKPVVNYITPKNLTVTITRDELTTVNVIYELKTENKITIDISGIDYKTTSIDWRVSTSTDNITWSDPTSWVKYYSTSLNNIIKDPKLCYYKIEIKPITGCTLTDNPKIVEFKGININVTFTFTGGTSVGYGKVNLLVDLLDKKQVKTAVDSIVYGQFLEFQHLEISDTIYNAKDGKNINWDGKWIKYADSVSIFTNLSTSKKHAYRIKPIDEFFNLGDYGNISYIDFNGGKEVTLTLTYIGYTFNNIHLGLPYFKDDTGFSIPIIPDIANFNIKIRTKSEWWDSFGDEIIIPIFGHVESYFYDIPWQILKSRNYTLIELFGSNHLGYISTEKFDVVQTDTTTNMWKYDPKLLIMLDGMYTPAYLSVPSTPTKPIITTSYVSVSQISKKSYYCSSNTTGQFGVYPCLTSYLHQINCIGFKDQYNPYDPRIRCQQALGTTCPPKIGTDINVFTFGLNLEQAPNGSFRYYIPKGTKLPSLIIYGVPPDDCSFTISRFGSPPTSKIPSFDQFSNFEKYPDLFPTTQYPDFRSFCNGKTIEQLKQYDWFATNQGGHISVTSGNYIEILAEGGWLYTTFYNDHAVPDNLFHTYILYADEKIYTEWYDSFTGSWLANGDPPEYGI